MEWYCIFILTLRFCLRSENLKFTREIKHRNKIVSARVGWHLQLAYIIYLCKWCKLPCLTLFNTFLNKWLYIILTNCFALVMYISINECPISISSQNIRVKKDFALCVLGPLWKNNIISGNLNGEISVVWPNTQPV